jgi:hypothetical protein
MKTAGINMDFILKLLFAMTYRSCDTNNTQIGFSQNMKIRAGKINSIRIFEFIWAKAHLASIIKPRPEGRGILLSQIVNNK